MSARRAVEDHGTGLVEVLAAGAVVGSYLAVVSGQVESVEVRIADARRRGGPVVDEAMAHLTDLGSVYGLAGSAAALALSGRPRLGRDLALSGMLAWGVAQGLKPVMDRPRPFETGTPRLVAIPAGTSWPSGHSAVIAAMATVVVDAAAESRRPRLTRWLGLGVAGLVGGSRLHVGVHHTTDVVAGFGVGVLCARLAHRVRRWLPWRNR